MVTTYTCIKCNTSWTPRKENPDTCPNPKCRTRLWKGSNQITPINQLSSTDPLDIKVSEIIEMSKHITLPTTDRTKMINKAIAWICEAPTDVLDGILSNLAKHREMTKHPTAHSLIEVVDQICQDKGKTLEELTSKLPEPQKKLVSSNIELAEEI